MSMLLEASDITTDVCRCCGACCCSEMRVEGNMGDLEFMEQVHGDALEVRWRGECSCGCGGLRFRGAVVTKCPSLREEDGRYSCEVYDERPSRCRDFNCVTWAIVNGHEETDLTKAAHAAWESLNGLSESPA